MKKEIQDEKQIREYMNRIIDHELDKPDTNMNLVKAYSAILDYREKGDSKYELDPKIQKEELKKLSKAYKEAYTKKQQEKHDIVPKFHKRALKVCTLVCSVVILISVSICTVSAINGVSPIELLSNFGKTIFNWKIDDPVEVNGMTFIRNGESRQYATIEECLQYENLDIYYPKWLPEGVYVESIIIYSSNGADQIILKFNTDTILFGAQKINSNNRITEDEEYSIIEINGILVYYNEIKGQYHAKMVIDDHIYSLTTPNIDIMENIISGLTKE